MRAPNLQALDVNRQDAWATHAVAHVYEMQGKPEEGIKFLSSTLRDWDVSCALQLGDRNWL